MEASTRAVAKWRYEPAREDGKAIDCTLTLDLNFMLPEVPRVKDLVSSLEDEDEVIREVACEWLGRLRPGTKAQHAALERTAQEDSSEQVRAAAARAPRKLDEFAKGQKGR